MADTIKYLLSEEQMPKDWYNLAADLPVPLPAVLHPGTLQPVGPDDLAPLFPMSLIAQEVSTERYIEIPEPVQEVFRQWRPSPLFRARRLEKALGTPARVYYKYEGVSPAGSHKPNTAIPQAFYNREAGIRARGGAAGFAWGLRETEAAWLRRCALGAGARHRVGGGLTPGVHGCPAGRPDEVPVRFSAACGESTCRVIEEFRPQRRPRALHHLLARTTIVPGRSSSFGKWPGKLRQIKHLRRERGAAQYNGQSRRRNRRQRAAPHRGCRVGRPAAGQLPPAHPEGRAQDACLPGDPFGRGASQQGPRRGRHPGGRRRRHPRAADAAARAVHCRAGAGA